MIRFSISRLEKEPIELVGSEPAEFLEMESSSLLTVAAPVSYELLVKSVSGGALVEGKVSTRLTGLCGRCLEPVEEEVCADNICLFLEIGEEEEMDISEDIRSEMLLALPMTLLCSEECRGLCPVCGANRNRSDCGCEPPASGSSCWEALDDLKL